MTKPKAVANPRLLRLHIDNFNQGRQLASPRSGILVRIALVVSIAAALVVL